MAELDALKVQRKTLKASCTRIKNYIDTVADVNNETVAQIKIRKEKLETYWQRYDEIQTRIESLGENADPANREHFEESYFNLTARMQHLMDTVYSAQSAQASAVSFNVDQSQQSRNNPHIRLPKLNLPTFSGKYQEWTPFSQMFRTIITNNNKLSNIEKFQYLKSSLSGDAADAIESLELSDENFQIAWDILENRYDKLRVIVQSHIQSILEIQPIKKENYTELRQLLNVTTKHMNALKALKRPVDSWDDLVVHILGNKLDPVTFRDWEDTLSGHDLPQLEQLTEFLMKKCQTLESIIAKENTSLTSVKSNQQNSRKSSISCAAAVKSKCSYCDGEHPIYFCQSFTKLPAGQRIAEVKKRKLCINCMKSKSHQAKQCTSSSCRTCGSKHNTLLHMAKRDNNEDSNVKDAANKEAQSTKETPGSSNASAVVTHSLSTIDKNYILLSTALVNVVDAAGNKISCRVLLDSGSQANLITRDFVSKLRIKTKQCSMSIVGINQVTTCSNETVTIKIESRYNKFQTTIQCLITDRITDSIPLFHLNKGRMDIPKNLQLADPQFNVPSHVQMLIGADLFWRLLCLGQIKSSFQGPTIQKTHLGWIVAGAINNEFQQHKASNRANVNTLLVAPHNSDVNLDHALTRFWQIESNMSIQNPMTTTERECEEQFLRTVRPDGEGRFIATLP